MKTTKHLPTTSSGHRGFADSTSPNVAQTTVQKGRIMQNTNTQHDTPTLHSQLHARHTIIKQSCEQATQRTDKPLIVGYHTALILQYIPTPAQCRNKSAIQTVDVPGMAKLWKAGITPHQWIIGSAESLVPILPKLYAFDLFHAWAQMAATSTFEQLIIMGDAIVQLLADAITVGIPDPGTPIHVRGSNITVRLSEELAGRLQHAQHSMAPDLTSTQSVVRIALGEFIKRPERYRGKSQCQKAYRHITGTALSPQETRTRLALTRHGLPEPECNITIRDLHFTSGAPVTVDLAWRTAKIAIEYDGDHHRTQRAQWMNDHQKRNLLQNNDWKVFVIDAAALATDEARANFAFSVARALELRGTPTRFTPVARPW